VNRQPFDPRIPGRALALALALATAGVPARAELVLLAGGGVLKVDGYHRQGDQVRLLLPGGGVLTLSMLRVDRILADEIVEDESFQVGGMASSLKIGFHDGEPAPETPFGDLIFATAARHEVNPRLVAAMVEAESAFDPHAVSHKGAAGLLQLMPATASRFGLPATEIFDPARNLEAGVRYIRWLSERFEGSVPLVLAGYNAGERIVERYGGVPPFRETRDYIRRVYSAAGAPLAGPP
jgi:hypothetical protein